MKLIRIMNKMMMNGLQNDPNLFVKIMITSPSLPPDMILVQSDVTEMAVTP